MGGVHLDHLEARLQRAVGGEAEIGDAGLEVGHAHRARRRDSCRRAISLGPCVLHPPASRARGWPPFHGLSQAALRPACASWMPGTAPCALMKLAIGFHAATCSADQMPASHGVMRPSGADARGLREHEPGAADGAAAEVHECQSLGTPFSHEYWHMGETKTRLGIVTERSVMGLKRRDMGVWAEGSSGKSPI